MKNFIVIFSFLISLPCHSATLIDVRSSIKYDLEKPEQIIQIDNYPRKKRRMNSSPKANPFANKAMRIIFTNINPNAKLTEFKIHSGKGTLYTDIYEILGAPISMVRNGESVHYMLISGLRPEAALLKASLELIDNNGIVLESKSVLFNFLKQELFYEPEVCIQKLSCAALNYEGEKTIYHFFESPCKIGGGVEEENTSLCEI